MCAHMASKTMNARRGGADIEIITRDQVIELNPVWWVVHGLTVNPDPSSSLPSMSGIKNRSVVWRSWPLVREKSTWSNQAGMDGDSFGSAVCPDCLQHKHQAT